RCPDDLERYALGQNTLGIVRDDDDRMVGHEFAREPEQILADVGIERDRALSIGPQKLLIAGNVARLERRGALRLHENMRLGPVLRLYQPPYLSPALIIADDKNKGRRRPQPPQFAGNIPGPAKTLHLTLDPQHWDRSLGRYPLDLAVDVVVEHHVADAENPRRVQAV